MLKREIGAKGIFLSAALIMAVSLSGCGDGMTEGGSATMEEAVDAAMPEEEADTGASEEKADAAPSEQKKDAVLSETEELTVQSKPALQSQGETSVILTDEGKAFLAQMCSALDDFHSESAMDETFWRDFLFHFYTGASSENAVTEQVYREDLGFEETVVKVSLEEAQKRAQLALGVDLPDLKPSFEDMEKGQTSFYYKDGCYYIGVSDLPDYQYTFSECAADAEDGADTIATYAIDFMGESNVGTVTFRISPEENENGFVIRSKSTVFVK